MSSFHQPVEYLRATDGLTLLVTGGETDLGRMLFVRLIEEGWPLAHLHLLFRRARRGPSASERFSAFCRESPLAAGLRARLGPEPDLALADRVTVHAAAPARDDLGLAPDVLAGLQGAVGAVIIAARSKRPDSDPQIALDRDLRHPLVIQRIFSGAALLFVTDVDAVSDAGHAPGTIIAEREAPRNFDPHLEAARIAQLACHGPASGDRGAIVDRRAAAFARAKMIGFPTTGGYARAVAEALWLRHLRAGGDELRQCLLRIGRLAPAAKGPAPGWAEDPGTLDALADLLALPVRALPVPPESRLHLAPVDEAAGDVLFAMTALLTHQAPHVLHATPPSELDLPLGRAVDLLQLALRTHPVAVGSARGAFRRWVVASADPARAAADIDKARAVAGRLRGSAAGLEGFGQGRADSAVGAFAAAAVAGLHWLDATSAELDTNLRTAFTTAERWLPDRRLAFSRDRFAGIARSGGHPVGIVAGHPAPDEAWRSLARTFLTPRLATRAVGASPSSDGRPAAAAATSAMESLLGLGARLLRGSRPS